MLHHPWRWVAATPDEEARRGNAQEFLVRQLVQWQQRPRRGWRRHPGRGAPGRGPRGHAVAASAAGGWGGAGGLPAAVGPAPLQGCPCAGLSPARAKASGQSVPDCQNVSKCVQICPHLYSVKVWPNLSRSVQICPNLSKSVRKPCLDRFGQIWTDLDRFGQIWTDLDRLGQIWPDSRAWQPMRIGVAGLPPPAPPAQAGCWALPQGLPFSRDPVGSPEGHLTGSSAEP
jgi:hypothetical protein